MKNYLTYQLHKPSPKRFKRRRVIVNGPNVMLDMDLLDLRDIKGKNYGKRYFLTMVDVFSKKAYACVLRRKTAEEVAMCFKKLLDTQFDAVPKSIRTDHGTFLSLI